MSDAVPDSATPHRRNAAWYAMLAAMIVVALINRLSHFWRPMEGDGPMFIYMGKLVSEGGRWGQDLVDNKFPTVGLIFSFCWRLFGAYWPAYVVLGALISAAATWALARAAKRNFDAHAADATLVFSIVYLNFSWLVWIFGGFQLETPLILFTCFGALAALETLRSSDARDAFALGLCAGTAALLKPTGLSVAAAFAVAMLFSNLPWRQLVRLSLAAGFGILIPISVAVTYLIASDTLQQIPIIYREISTYAANSAWDWKADYGKPIMIVVLAGFPMLVRGVGSIVARYLKSSIIRDRVIDRCSSFVLCWLALETVGVVAQRRMYGYHFLVMAPPLALLFGWLPRRASAASLLSALAPIALLSLNGTYRIFQDEGVRPSTLATSEYLKTHAKQGDAVWCDNSPRVLLETGLRPGSRCVLTFLFANSDPAPLYYSDMILNDFQSHRPQYIVLDADMSRYVDYQSKRILEFARFPQRRENFQAAWNRIESYVRANYVIEAAIPGEKGAENIWRRRDAAPAEGHVTLE